MATKEEKIEEIIKKYSSVKLDL